MLPNYSLIFHTLSHLIFAPVLIVFLHLICSYSNLLVNFMSLPLVLSVFVNLKRFSLLFYAVLFSHYPIEKH